jgi:hypothetical protein
MISELNPGVSNGAYQHHQTERTTAELRAVKSVRPGWGTGSNGVARLSLADPSDGCGSSGFREQPGSGAGCYLWLGGVTRYQWQPLASGDAPAAAHW